MALSFDKRKIKEIDKITYEESLKDPILSWSREYNDRVLTVLMYDDSQFNPDIHYLTINIPGDKDPLEGESIYSYRPPKKMANRTYFVGIYLQPMGNIDASDLHRPEIEFIKENFIPISEVYFNVEYVHNPDPLFIIGGEQFFKNEEIRYGDDREKGKLLGTNKNFGSIEIKVGTQPETILVPFSEIYKNVEYGHNNGPLFIIEGE